MKPPMWWEKMAASPSTPSEVLSVPDSETAATVRESCASVGRAASSLRSVHDQASVAAPARSCTQRGAACSAACTTSVEARRCVARDKRMPDVDRFGKLPATLYVACYLMIHLEIPRIPISAIVIVYSRVRNSWLGGVPVAMRVRFFLRSSFSGRALELGNECMSRLTHSTPLPGRALLYRVAKGRNEKASIDKSERPPIYTNQHLRAESVPPRIKTLAADWQVWDSTHEG